MGRRLNKFFLSRGTGSPSLVMTALHWMEKRFAWRCGVFLFLKSLQHPCTYIAPVIYFLTRSRAGGRDGGYDPLVCHVGHGQLALRTHLLSDAANVGNSLGELDPDRLPQQLKREGNDWFAV